VAARDLRRAQRRGGRVAPRRAHPAHSGPRGPDRRPRPAQRAGLHRRGSRPPLRATGQLPRGRGALGPGPWGTRECRRASDRQGVLHQDFGADAGARGGAARRRDRAARAPRDQPGPVGRGAAREGRRAGHAGGGRGAHEGQPLRRASGQGRGQRRGAAIARAGAGTGAGAPDARLQGPSGARA